VAKLRLLSSPPARSGPPAATPRNRQPAARTLDEQLQALDNVLERLEETHARLHEFAELVNELLLRDAEQRP
jgi:hypothetical protein